MTDGEALRGKKKREEQKKDFTKLIVQVDISLHTCNSDRHVHPPFTVQYEVEFIRHQVVKWFKFNIFKHKMFECVSAGLYRNTAESENNSCFVLSSSFIPHRLETCSCSCWNSTDFSAVTCRSEGV